MINQSSNPRNQASGFHYGLMIIIALVIILAGLMLGAGLGVLVDRFLDQQTSSSGSGVTPQPTETGLVPSTTVQPVASDTPLPSLTFTPPVSTNTLEPSITLTLEVTASGTVLVTQELPAAQASASPQPEIAATPINARCTEPTYLNGLTYAFVQQEVPLYKEPVYDVKEGGEQIGTLKKGEKVAILTDLNDQRSPKCTRNSYLWAIRTESELVGWTFEYYQQNANNEPKPLFTPGYYLAPNPPQK
jgi:hypothetical protein